jgi:hypothetical protein
MFWCYFLIAKYMYILVLLCFIFFGNESNRDSVKGDSLHSPRSWSIGQMFEKKALVLLYKSFYLTFKSFLVRLPKRNIDEVVFEVEGC